MKILLSPAKTLDFKSHLPTDRTSELYFRTQADFLNNALKDKSPTDLKKLMSISDRLADLNWQRNQEWDKADERPSVFAFKGDVYVGLDAYTIDKKHWDYLQNTVRILSGQFGLLKPFDPIKPYRLEMGTELKTEHHKNLYEYWDTQITDKLNEELSAQEVVVNLASQEYYNVIKEDLLKTTVITPVFKDYKNGKLKFISFYGKKARGLMTRFAIDHQITNVEDLKTFNTEGYAFDESLSSDTDWVFTR
ncbi:MAG: hypothetical protein CR968_05585 [Flavobacteriia bacterium]|nr:MAG: hypothetical protein CR968_05585 [Flavobacteriia bacterium]